MLAICDGAMVPSGWLSEERERLAIHTSGEAGRLNLRADSLAGHRFGPLAERADDLIRIAAYAYAVDQRVSRGGKADPQRRQWRRELALCIPVAEPQFWRQPAVQAALAEALGYATDDAWSFAFSPAEHRQLPLTLGASPSRSPNVPTAVILLSGGLDSLCATVEAVTRTGQRPVLVSHRSAPFHDHTQQVLADGLRRHVPAWDFPHLSFWIHQQGAEAIERTRRTRGFLVAALGTAVAGQFHLPTVLLADNGYVSINPSINAQLVGALNSRGTHPVFLRLVQRLADLVFPEAVRVTNPLAERTRAEALSILQEQDCLDLIPLSRSCATSRLPKETPHCGVCSQCVDRRFATVAAGLEVYDPPERYRTDVFTASLPGRIPPLLARSYAGFAQRTADMDDETIMTELPELEACLDLDAPDVGDEAQQLTGVLKRHAAEVVRALAIQVGLHGEALYRGQLPADCLLRVAAGAGATEPDIDDAPASPPLGASPLLTAALSAVERPRLEHQDSIWFICFAAETGQVKDSVGMARLARLLKAPGQELTALDLVRWSSPGKQGRAPALTEARATVGELGDHADESARQSYQARIRELAAELADVDPELEASRNIELLAELEWLEDEIRRTQGKGRRPRPVPDELERARQTVTKTINDALAMIARRLPQLYEHLQASLHIATICRYDPHPPQHWDITL